ncbi:uncharacterized protein LOC114644953 [Erpetoichthys calabaricus]|uniref:uncharacterized protein LOC114644953 n=1 Tax=Erpetoichthys calabaricus TaxID=27687 RepID=UPI00223475D1|nr:uncharacterized protein LOC114644953 [Erpetoichthys calabaricus]
MYRAKGGKTAHELKSLLELLDEQTMDVTTHKRATVLQGLPLYLREYKKLSTTCHDTDSLQIYTNEMKIGILEVVRHHETNPGAAAMNVAVVIEGQVVSEELVDFTTAFVILVGLLYARNIQYPKELKYTFETDQNSWGGGLRISSWASEHFQKQIWATPGTSLHWIPSTPPQLKEMPHKHWQEDSLALRWLLSSTVSLIQVCCVSLLRGQLET